MEKEKPFPVFVDNIDENVKTKDLRKVFARAGLVKEVTIISHYGFVNFRSPDDAVVAIECCNNYILNGKNTFETIVNSRNGYNRQNPRALTPNDVAPSAPSIDALGG